jgi:RND family efflux transporter MFP subunit
MNRMHGFACVVLLAAPWMSACREGHGAPAAPLPAVTVAEVEERQVADWDEFVGHFAAVDSVEIRPRVAGTIDRVAFKAGATVHKGDLLFQIDPRPYQAEVAHADAELAQARTTAKLAASSLERAKQLIAADATTREDFETRTAGAERGSAAVSAAAAAVTRARLNLAWTQIRSPIAGRVGRAEITVGNLVQAGASRLTTVVSLDPIYVDFDADERSFLQLAAQRRASGGAPTPIVMGMSDEEGKFPHQGTLDFLDNQLDPHSGTVRARAKFANPDQRFAPGAFAHLKVMGSREYLAPVISDRAIGTDQDKKFVFVLNTDSTLAYRPVELGRLVDGYRVVKSGLRAHEKIIVNGLQRVRPGAKVMATPGPMLAETGGETAAAKSTGGGP